MMLLLRVRAGRRPTLHMPQLDRELHALSRASGETRFTKFTIEDDRASSHNDRGRAETIGDDRATSNAIGDDRSTSHNDRGRSCYGKQNDRGRSCYELDDRATSQHPWMVEVDERKDRARLQFHFHPTLLSSTVHLSSLPITLCDLQESGMPFDRRHAK